jgi:hypothetical protein
MTVLFRDPVERVCLVLNVIAFLHVLQVALLACIIYLL